MHQTMERFLSAVENEGRTSTAASYSYPLNRFDQWLGEAGLDATKVVTDDLLEYQQFLANTYRKPNGKPLAKGTQVTWLAIVKSYYRWMYRTGLLPCDPAQKVRLAKIIRRKVACDALTQQEAIGILDTQAAHMKKQPKDSRAWAIEYRNLAMLAIGLASGRRCSSIRDLRVKDLDHKRNELRVEWEKGKPGRVLPIASWALRVAKSYVDEARPILLAAQGKSDPGWLFTGVRTRRVCKEYLTRLVKDVQERTVEACPDLEDLADKRLTSHSLRTSFATILFLNGAGIRFLNEMLLHRHLATTVKYTPLDFIDLRRAIRRAHPRA